MKHHRKYAFMKPRRWIKSNRSILSLILLTVLQVPVFTSVYEDVLLSTVSMQITIEYDFSFLD